MQLSYPAKIRLMLALLTATLLLTAVIAQKTYTEQDNLHQTGKLLEDNIHRQEKKAFGLLEKKESFDNLKTLDQQGESAQKFITDITTADRIWVLTYKSGELVFWSGIKYIPQLSHVKEGISFIETGNAYVADSRYRRPTHIIGEAAGRVREAHDAVQIDRSGHQVRHRFGREGFPGLVRVLMDAADNQAAALRHKASTSGARFVT